MWTLSASAVIDIRPSWASTEIMFRSMVSRAGACADHSSGVVTGTTTLSSNTLFFEQYVLHSKHILVLCRWFSKNRPLIDFTGHTGFTVMSLTWEDHQP